MPKTFEERVREEFEQKFPNLQWQTTGGTEDIFYWFLSEFKKEVERMRKNTYLEIYDIVTQKYVTNRTRSDDYGLGYDKGLEELNETLKNLLIGEK